VFASGNTWNVTQQADGSGLYPLQALVTGDSQQSGHELPAAFDGRDLGVALDPAL